MWTDRVCVTPVNGRLETKVAQVVTVSCVRDSKEQLVVDDLGRPALNPGIFVHRGRVQDIKRQAGGLTIVMSVQNKTCVVVA